MPRVSKPKGLTIYVEKVRRGDLIDRHYTASVKSKGRQGAVARRRFLAASGEQRAFWLYEWAHGRSVSMPRCA